MASDASAYWNGDLWRSMEASIDQQLGPGFDDDKRQRLFAAHAAALSQQEALADNLRFRTDSLETYYRDHVLCDRFFFTEAANILGADDFERLFNFPADAIDEHLQISDLQPKSGP